MVKAVQRRRASVACTKQLMEAVTYIRQQRQISNQDRICKYMHREHRMPAGECRRLLAAVVEDGFLLEYTALGYKGMRTGLEQEGYRVPGTDELNLVNDGHDWYCFECHLPGELLLCSECHRCFHHDCTGEDHSGPKFTCTICKDYEAGKKKNKMKKKMLNTLLSYTILRLREKTKELHKIGLKTDEEDFSRFVYQRMDLNSMEAKVQASRYRCLEEFYADTQVIHHNCYLVYGEHGGMTALANIMLKDCKYDLDEIELCPNCYYMSNAKPEQWFCQPCSPPHDLVWAKLKGFGYWPAKVINEVEGKMDVRFFGGWHQRAVIPAEYIRPVTTSIGSLQIKRTAGFTKACKELEVHKKLLEEREHEFPEPNPDSHDSFPEPEPEPEEETGKGGEESADKGEGREEEEGEREEAEPPQQVTSTSVDTKRKRKSPAVKVTPPDESSVTSSEDKVTQPQLQSPKPVVVPATASTPSQTLKIKTHVAGTQTIKVDPPEDGKDVKEESGPPEKKKARLSFSDSELQTRVDKASQETTERLKKLHEEDKAKAIKELTERLKKDFEEDKQTAVSRAMTNVSREIEKARKAAEEKSKEQYMEEMKKLAQRHKEHISLTKKKQWCFNCEEEAMYHCCWNTSYCSVRCQQEHWHKEHKHVCRRKR